MTDHSALIERLEANEPLVICPFDRRSPEYWTTPDDAPCKFCGGVNDGPDKCRGADTSLFKQAAAALRDQQAFLEKWKRLKGYADDQVMVERSAYRSLLADHEGRALPSAPNQAKEAGE